MPLDEKVLVIGAERFRDLGSFHGFRPADAAYQHALLDSKAFEFLPRFQVESDPNFKQLIPYIVLKYQDRLFHYRRGSMGTEKRLQALRSIGIGGHISSEDVRGGEDLYRTGMLRELREEVTISAGWTEQLLGFINDDRTPVGRVHLGVVHLFELAQPDVFAQEEAIAEGAIDSLEKLVGRMEEFETWSQFVLAHLLTLAGTE
jgi:predicted NUDIX family phosphoesterase